jgi:hypothetical protein
MSFTRSCSEVTSNVLRGSVRHSSTLAFTSRAPLVTPLHSDPMDTLEDIDARIADLREDIRKLNVRRNVLSGFCKLPPEILTHILGLLQTAVKPSYSNYTHLDYTTEFYRPKN